MNGSPEIAKRQPFIEHIYELRRRLLLCLAFVALGSGLGYYLNDSLARLIQQPLGEKLYFTTPTGGFNFIFILCVSFGMLVALPFIIYQTLAFLRPVLPKDHHLLHLWYAVCSFVLAMCGVAFAYFISLPAALHFLTSIGNSANIQSLMATDSYFRFALTYLIGFAVLFQIPLLLIIINRISPLKPGKLLKAQRYVILGSFIVAAILTPTPDPFNQTLMAGPTILLFQLSIIIIWIRNMKRPKTRAAAATSEVVATDTKAEEPVALQQVPALDPRPALAE